MINYKNIEEMNKLDLEFIQAYADIFCDENTPMEQVINQINDLFAEGDNNDGFNKEQYKIDLIARHKIMKDFSEI